MKLVQLVFALLLLCSCTDTTNENQQRSKDSTALEAIDSSVIINDSTRLSNDSSKTTVTR